MDNTLDSVALDSTTLDPATISTLRWQCRRGMLELDILLNNFINSLAVTENINEKPQSLTQQLTLQQRQSFELLLSYPDQTLIDLLLGNTMSGDAKISDIVKLIRSTPMNIPININ